MADRIDPRLHYVGQLPPPSQHRPPEAPAVPQPFANPPPHQLQNDSVLPQQPYFMTSSPTTSRPLPLPNPLHPPPPPPPPPHSHPNSHPHSHSHSQQLHSASAVDPALESTSPVHASPTDDGNEPDHEDDYGADHTQVGSPADSIKRPRACDSCRGLKVRCEQDPTQPSVSCKRCAKAKRQCITTPPARKRQKKADSRVAELEKKIDALTACLNGRMDPQTAQAHIGHGEYRNPPLPSDHGPYAGGLMNHDWTANQTGRVAEPRRSFPPSQTNYDYNGSDAKRRRLNESRHSSTTIPEDMDDIHRDIAENHSEIGKDKDKLYQMDYRELYKTVDNLIPPELAEKVFHRYVNEICPHFPAVPLQPGITAWEVREKRPLLFLAILAGSSHGSADNLVKQSVQKELTLLLKNQFADIIWRNGEKSLEIVQALQLGVLWYRPPLHYEQHNFYMMVNCAAVMALDLGLGRREKLHVARSSAFSRSHPDPNSIEARRTFLVCYYLCMSVTMVLRRPILLRWTKYMDESVRVLETAPDALPSDKVLCLHVKLIHIGEEVSREFQMDDPSAEVSISEPKTNFAIKHFESALHGLRQQNKGDDPALKLAEHVTNLYMHEIALHQNQSAANFQPPFPNEAFASRVGKHDIGTQQLDAMCECLSATRGILDTILAVPLETLITLPVIFCVRAIYAIVCLMKMWVSVSVSASAAQRIRREELGIERYTDRLIQMFHDIVAKDAQSPHGKFFWVAKRLKEKFAWIKQGLEQSEEGQPKDEHSSRHKKPRPAQPSANHSENSTTRQTSLHVLSEVAVGNSAPGQPEQQMMNPLAPPQNTINQNQTWYGNPPMDPAAPLPQDMMQPQMNFDPNFSFVDFDHLTLGNGADLASLFVPEGLFFPFAGPDGTMPGYDGGPF